MQQGTGAVPRRVPKDEILAIFEAGTKASYRKRGSFLARPAAPGETVLTIVAGKLETLAATGWGDVVVMNIEIGSAVERYIVGAEMFAKRYERTGRTIYTDGFSWEMANAKGKVEAFRYEGPPITFEAPWGEDMLMEAGDWLAHATGGRPDDIYRIERKAFEGTYSEEPAHVASLAQTES